MHNLDERRLGIREEEQRRIGSDLHDGLGQHLTGIACLAAALREDLRDKDLSAAGRADEIVRLLNASIDLARRQARVLCPLQIDGGCLHAALEDLARHVRRMHRVECSFENGGPPLDVEPEAALQLYRIAQEAINNAMRHGGADRIAVKLQTWVEPFRLVVEDNGRGFEPGNSHSEGMGLRLMEHRAARIGARFTIGRAARGGTRVECIFDHH